MGKRHYLSKTKEYRIWVNLRAFHKDQMSDEWKESPTVFVSYIKRLANCGAKGYTLVRTLETKGFEEGNVQFVKRADHNSRRHFNKYIGIRRRGKRFVARITVNRTEHTIGSADSPEAAIKLRNEYIAANNLPHRIQ
jgi:hypothetical protein